jgi:hypothetical protein
MPEITTFRQFGFNNKHLFDNKRLRTNDGEEKSSLNIMEQYGDSKLIRFNE